MTVNRNYKVARTRSGLFSCYELKSLQYNDKVYNTTTKTGLFSYYKLKSLPLVSSVFMSAIQTGVMKVCDTQMRKMCFMQEKTVVKVHRGEGRQSMYCICRRKVLYHYR